MRFFVAALALVVISAGIASSETVSLENLIREMSEAEKPVEPTDHSWSPVSARVAIESAIAARNVVVNRDGGFLQFLMKSDAVWGGFSLARARAADATTYHARASANVAEHIRLSAIAGQESAGLQGAQVVLRDATANLQAADAALQQARTSLDRHIARMRRDAPEFFRAYQMLRTALPHRRHEANAAIASILMDHTERSADFIEGHVVAAAAQIYEGRDSEAAAHLEAANEIFKRYPPLASTIIAEDCCATWLLLGRPDKVANFISSINATDARVRSMTQEWLLAAHASMRGRPEEALKKYNLAIKKAKGRAPAKLKAEAAMAMLESASTPTKIHRAEELLQTSSDDDDWQVLRARAAVSAASERWEEATDILGRARDLAPPCMEASLNDQEDSYKSERPWTKVAR